MSRTLIQVFRRTVDGFVEEKLVHWAAALTYYGVLAVFPMLLVLLAVVGLVGRAATEPLLGNLREMAPGPGREILTRAIESLEQGQAGAGLLLVVGLGGALWSASGYMAAFMDASNVIHRVEERRPVWKTVAARLGMSAGLLVLLAATIAIVGLTGPVAREVGDLVGLGETATTLWAIVKWPVLIVLVAVVVAFLYWAAPDVEHRRFRWVTAGSAVAVLLWVGVSAVYSVFVALVGTYHKTYGPLGSAIAFLVWMWLTNIAVLAGAAFNAEMERAAGAPAARRS